MRKFIWIASGPILVLLLLAIGWYYYREYRMPHQTPYDALIIAEAHERGLDPFLVRAVIWRESRFKPTMLGTAQERGLMQVTPEVGIEWAQLHHIPNFQVDDLYQPETNIRAGTWYLAHSIHHWDQTDNPIAFGLAEYNAGRTNALRWVDPDDAWNHEAFLSRITYPTTRKYVEVILQKRDEYREELPKQRWYQDLLNSAGSVSPAPASP